MILKIFLCFVRASCIRSLRYRFDFIMGLLEGLSMFAVNLLFFTVSLSLSGEGSINSAEAAEVFLLSALFQIFTGFFYGLFIDNITGLKYYINRGDLDWMLMKPVALQFYVSVRFINFGHIVSAILAIPVVSYLFVRFQLPFSLAGTLLAGAYLLLALFGAYALLLMATSLAILFTSSGNVSGIIMPVLSLGKYPRRIYGAGFSYLLLLACPALLLCDMAKDALLGKWQMWELGLFLVVVIAQMILAGKLFQVANTKYRSSGS